jgi:hypothetical protein
MFYPQPSPFNVAPSSAAMSAYIPKASSACAAGAGIFFLLTSIMCYVFGLRTCAITSFLRPNLFCNTCTGNNREEKVASLDANHMKAWKAVAAMRPKPQMLR